MSLRFSGASRGIRARLVSGNRQRQWGYAEGLRLPSVAGVARHAVATKVDLVGRVEGKHHLHHPPRSLLLRFVVTLPYPVREPRFRVFALLDVAEATSHPERGGNKIHQGKQF